MGTNTLANVWPEIAQWIWQHNRQS
jgi:hypothetical protein